MENHKILIVDNEYGFSSDLKEVLEKSIPGIHCRKQETGSGNSALSKPDLVILGTITPREMLLLHRWLKKTPAFNDLPLIVIDALPRSN